MLILCLIGLQSVFAQSREVSGVVTSAEDGMSVPGVSVIVKGTTIGTSTDFDGKYTLSVPADGKILVFSAVGMKKVEMEIVSNTINVTMESESIGVDEVTIVAYGTKGRVGMKGSIAVVGEKELEETSAPTFDQAIQGKVTGVHIIRGSGQPGTPAKIRIRGNSSISGSSEPLYILDGIAITASDFAALNSNDFESISVLKDAASTAIYGSRGSNGVILIASKKGKAGKTKINYGFQFGFSDIPDPKFEMMNSAEKLEFEELAKKGKGWDLSPINSSNSGLTAEELAANAAELNRLKGVNTDWFDLLTRRASTKTHDLNISGGDEKTNFYASYQYLDQEGFALRSNLERHAVRLNLNHKISDKLEIGLKASMGATKGNEIESEGSVSLANPFASVYLANPYEEPYDENGIINPGSGRVGTNALERVLNTTATERRVKTLASAYAAYEVIEGLKVQSKFGIDYRTTDNEFWTNPDSYVGENITNGGAGDLQRQNSQYRNINFQNTINYEKVLNDVHTFSVMAGTEFNSRTFESFGFTGYGLNPKLPRSPEGITPGSETNKMIPRVFGSLPVERNLFSIFGVANYVYDNKYAFTASVRRDGSSAFGKNNQYATLGSISFEWSMHNESFIQDIDWISSLKFKANYGTTGNQEPISDYESLTTWGTTNYNGVQGVALGRAGDPDIKWEIGSQLNIGFSYSLLENRISGDFDVYNKITNDLFISQSLSMTNSVNSRDVNAGKMRNRGIEFSVNADVIRTNDFTWSVGGNISYNENEILSLGQVDEFEQGTSIIRKGLPLGSHYAVKWGGVDPASGDPLYYDKEGNITNKYGSYEVADFGTFNPPTTGGFNTSIKYKGFEASALFIFAHGFKRYNNQTFFQENPAFAQFNLLKKMKTIWRKPGDITEIQRVDSKREFSSKDIEDASYLRFKNVKVSYTLPKSLLAKQKTISNVKFYGQVENIHTWTKFTGFDPEDDNNIAQYEYPTPITYTMGINISF